MARRTRRSDPNAAGLALGLGWHLKLEGRSHGASLRIEHAERAPLELEITFSELGPVVRTSAAALHIDALQIDARCEEFSIAARKRFSVETQELALSAEGGMSLRAEAVQVAAHAGDIQLRANDDVQLLGEQVLLNCERPEPMPTWIPAPQPIEARLPRQTAWGDPELLARLAHAEKDGTRE
jgi:hypothetical protein